MNEPEGRKHDGWEEVARSRLVTIELRDAEIKKLVDENVTINGQIAAVAAAASFNPEADRDLESAVRRLYHEWYDAVRKLKEIEP